MPRLVKTVTEMEGRFEEKWVLVEEDGIVCWEPEAELASSASRARARPARSASPARARYTVDVALPGMLHAVVLRSPVAHGARDGAAESTRRVAVSGVRAVVGPETELSFSQRSGAAVGEPDYAGRRSRSSRPTRSRPPRRALRRWRWRSTRCRTSSTSRPPSATSASTAIRSRTRAATSTPRWRPPRSPSSSGRDARAAADADRAARRGRLVEAGRADLLDRDAGHVRRRATSSTRRFDVPKERVRVIAEYIGGGFGGKQGAGFEALMAVELSKRTGRPVRLVIDRHGEQLDGGCRPATHQTVASARSRDGTLIADRSEALVEYGMAGWRAGHDAGADAVQVANARGDRGNLRSNLRRGNAFRAPGVMEGVTRSSRPWTSSRARSSSIRSSCAGGTTSTATRRAELPYSLKALLVCYDRVAELAGWDDRERLRAPQPTGCCAAWGARRRSGGAAAARPRTPRCRIGGDGVAHVSTGIQDIGTGTLTTARHRRGRGARPAGRPRARGRRRHRPEHLRPGRGRIADDAVGDARGARRRGQGQAQAAAARGRRVRDRADDLELRDGRFRSQRRRASTRRTPR